MKSEPEGYGSKDSALPVLESKLKKKGRSKTRFRVGRILNIALPSGLQSGLDVLDMSIALFFIGALGNEYVASVSISTGYLVLFYPVVSILYIAANAQISRAFGARDYTKIKSIFSVMFYSAIIFSIPTALVAHFGAHYYFAWLNLGDTITNLGVYYLGVTVFIFPALMVKNVMISSFAALGDTRKPFMIKIGVTILSVLLNYSFITGGFGMPKFGMEAAAFVTVGIAYIEALILLTLITFKKSLLLKLRFTFNFYYLKYGLKIGIPTGIERLYTLVSISIILKFVAGYGDSIVTGFQVGTRVESFSFVPGFGFMVAAMALMGQSLGARKIAYAKEYVRLCLIIASSVMGTIGLLLAIFGYFLTLIFISHDAVALQSGMYYLIAVGLSQVPLICCFVYDGALRGAGKTNVPLMINISSITILRLLPMYICISFGLSVYFLYAIICVETYIRFIFFHFAFNKGTWIPKFARKIRFVGKKSSLYKV
ncbi:MATE family efflux transporter [Helicobacter sp. 11S02629-2]|uniref:MATE family efflux transporter n=1 Tax=Helicobacter sp. 11S02629-2 TaxID=1476195 RepID=UPI000BA5C572|nr:MATE family efflux transporter [Helicobacter sp. 11S02629-2]